MRGQHTLEVKLRKSQDGSGAELWDKVREARTGTNVLTPRPDRGALALGTAHTLRLGWEGHQRTRTDRG